MRFRSLRKHTNSVMIELNNILKDVPFKKTYKINYIFGQINYRGLTECKCRRKR